METRFSPPRTVKYFLFILLVFFSAGVGFLWGLVGFGAYHLGSGDIPSDLKWWFSFVMLIIIAIVLTFMIKRAWQRAWRASKGVVVRERGVAIHGEDIDWADIEEIRVDPNEEYISVVLSKPIDEQTIIGVRKADITPTQHFLQQVRELGVVVRDESLNE